jgi:hypothetical protein
MYLLTELAVAGGAGYAIYLGNQAVDDYDSAKTYYEDLPRETEQPVFKQARARMNKKWDDTRTTRRYQVIALGTLAGLHLLNVVDATAWFPSTERISIATDAGDGMRAGVAVSIALEARR